MPWRWALQICVQLCEKCLPRVSGAAPHSCCALWHFCCSCRGAPAKEGVTSPGDTSKLLNWHRGAFHTSSSEGAALLCPHCGTCWVQQLGQRPLTPQPVWINLRFWLDSHICTPPQRSSLSLSHVIHALPAEIELFLPCSNVRDHGCLPSGSQLNLCCSQRREMGVSNAWCFF